MWGAVQFQILLDAIADDLIARPGQNGQNVEIAAPVTEDSRAVKVGGLFVARKGLNTDSHDLIPVAVAQGAVAVVGERAPGNASCPVPYAQVKDAQQAIGRLAAAYYGYPSRQIVVIGVTGTDGKTTTTALIFHMLNAAGLKVGMISTVSAVIGNQELDTGFHVTTP